MMGTAPMGFDAGRHDQTLFSFCARLNGMRLHRPSWLNIQLNQKASTIICFLTPKWVVSDLYVTVY